MENLQTETKIATLFERLGGEAKVRKIVNDTLDKNLKNPAIGAYFQKLDMDNLKRLVFEFFSMGTGGPHQYSGRDMASAHSNHKITEADYNSSNDDLLEALAENGVGEKEQREVIAILDTLKQQVIRG
jgi:truncated hemoglobin YjbI